MRYPVASGESDQPEAEETPESATMDKNHDPFSWDVDANGQLTAHMCVTFFSCTQGTFANSFCSTPQVEFGIVFDSAQLANAAVRLMHHSSHVQISVI